MEGSNYSFEKYETVKKAYYSPPWREGQGVGLFLLSYSKQS